uniref:shematrin-like protein 1 n=1 Tax=Anopheles coluzzii TaxID=1518534 RepID=UPI0020FF983B|nr:shematrin-like protein 1 [Anopheles coluzzii]
MSFSFVSQACLAVIVSVFGVVLSVPLDGQQQTVAIEGGAKRQEKRGIGLAYTGLTGFGAYDTSLGLAGYPATAYVTPTVIKSTYTVPAAATYHTAAYDAAHSKFGYGGFYPASYGGFGTGGYGYGGFAAPAATYSKIVHPATSTYTKVIQTYPSAAVVAAGTPAVASYTGVGSLGGYVY